MKTSNPTGGEALPTLPQASDILAGYSKLITLLDLTSEMVDDMTAEGMSPARKGLLMKTQNMMHVAWDVAHRLDKDLDAYMGRPSN
jgi:hypothetical protein